MKEKIWATKCRDELSENSRDIREKKWKCIDLIKNTFFFCVYKKLEITKETWEKMV